MTENILLNKSITWTNIENPIRRDYPLLQEEFKVPLIFLHDCMRPEQLPKYEKYRDGYFFLLRIYDSSVTDAEMTVPHISNKLAIFVQDNRITTLHKVILPPIRKFIDLKKEEETLPDIIHLVHQLMRISIISYEEAVSELQRSYEAYEREVLSKSGRISNTSVYQFRRKIFLIKTIMQLTQQALYNSKEFWKGNPSLQQDIKENIDQIYFKLEGLSHNSDQLFALNLSLNEERNTDVMKVLTLFASIMLPLTFIASFYGMNFDYIPGLHSTTGFIGAIVLMVTITFFTSWYFIKKQWFKSM